ncbi:MAG: GNAT family N-acetyltransferase [Oscillospiraceae bacterium]|nr:GNAT family N-acetyltransferase [Oscillospiraceae bacterium]
MRNARAAQGAARPHAAPVLHGDAKGRRAVRARRAGGLFPFAVSDDLRLALVKQAGAVDAAVAWALKQAGVTRVEAETEPDNTASQRVLEKCGFLPSGTFGEEGPRFFKAASTPES